MSTKRIKAAYMAETGYNSATWLLPADAASYERMVEQMAKAIFPHTVSEPSIKDARAALRAIGITAPKKGRK